jgi:hypothetical protein
VTTLFAVKEVGSRIATRVRVREGAFAGQVGIVVEVHHGSSICVRFTKGPLAGKQLPFGLSELEVLDATD